jgi:hypothetical protein
MRAVIVFAADAPRRVYPSRFVKMAAVETGGTCVIRGLPPGAYLLAAVEAVPANWDAPESLETLKPRATAATLGDDETRVTVVVKGGE